jgi:hypothetical protein
MIWTADQIDAASCRRAEILASVRAAAARRGTPRSRLTNLTPFTFSQQEIAT